MKKLIENIPLNALVIKGSDLPIKNCVVSMEEGYWPSQNHGSITGVRHYDGEVYFINESDESINWTYCAKIIERYPRDVPEGVPPLPDDKPFLAFIGKGGSWLSKKAGSVRSLALWCYASYNDRWQNNNGIGYYGGEIDYFYAINASTKWAAEEFPELVEAMEYEAITISDESDYGKRKVIGHRLGDQEYDLDWQEVSSEGSLTLEPKDVFGEEEPKYALTLKEGLEAQRRNDLAREDSAEDGYIKGFRDGMARQKWLDQQWKYETYANYSYDKNATELNDREAIFNAAREMEESE